MKCIQNGLHHSSAKCFKGSSSLSKTQYFASHYCSKTFSNFTCQYCSKLIFNNTQNRFLLYHVSAFRRNDERILQWEIKLSNESQQNKSYAISGAGLLFCIDKRFVWTQHVAFIRGTLLPYKGFLHWLHPSAVKAAAWAKHAHCGIKKKQNTN